MGTLCWRMFVYGTLKRAERLHPMYLAGASFLGPARVRHHTLWAERHEGGQVGIAVMVPKSFGTVEGELFEVDERTFQKVRALEGGYDGTVVACEMAQDGDTWVGYAIAWTRARAYPGAVEIGSVWPPPCP